MLGFSGSARCVNTPPSLTNKRNRGAIMATPSITPIEKPCEACGEHYSPKWGMSQFLRSRACSRGCSTALGQRNRNWPSFAEKFWSKVDKAAGHGPWGNCWVWTGYRLPFGYGSMHLGESTVKTHRLSYEMHTGRPIPKGLIVRHRCDNPACLKPDHLLLGTLQDNSDDAKERGRTRAPRGEARHNAKLTEGQVRVIKFGGAPQFRLAKRFRVTRGCIAAIREGRTWKHVGRK